jgi:hypothetical protein
MGVVSDVLYGRAVRGAGLARGLRFGRVVCAVEPPRAAVVEWSIFGPLPDFLRVGRRLADCTCVEGRASLTEWLVCGTFWFVDRSRQRVTNGPVDEVVELYGLTGRG